MPYNLQLFFCICLLLRGERVSLSVERRYLSVLMHMFQSMRIMLTTYSRSQGVPFLFQGPCEQTVNVLQLMEEEGFEPSLVMLNSLINAFGTAGRHLEALAVFQHIKDSGMSPDVVTYTTLMKTFMRAKKFEKVSIEFGIIAVVIGPLSMHVTSGSPPPFCLHMHDAEQTQGRRAWAAVHAVSPRRTSLRRGSGSRRAFSTPSSARCIGRSRCWRQTPS